MIRLASTLLGPAGVAEAIEMALRSSAKYITQEVNGHYRDTPEGHLIGRLGEMAAEQWFVDDHGFSVVSHWRNQALDHLCDLVVQGWRIEVKTWSARFWQRYGRCVAVTQLEKIERKADLVLWATVEAECTAIDEWRADPPRGVFVTFRGYSTLEDIREAEIRLTGPDHRPKVKNHQVDAPRDNVELIELLEKEPRHEHRTDHAWG